MILEEVVEKDASGQALIIKADGKLYYRFTEAARLLAISIMTLDRKCRIGYVDLHMPKGVERVEIELVVDPMNGRRYISESNIDRLRFEKRLVPAGHYN